MKISVVIPVYNAVRTIRTCLDSVVTELLGSSYPWEIIVVNDGSKDTSLEAVIAYKNASPYREYIHVISQKNQGVGVARNNGMVASQGDFIAFNDSDDRWLPGRIKIQMDYLLANPSVGMVAGIYGKDHVSVIKRVDKETQITIKDQIFKNYFSPPCVLFRKSVLDKVGLFHLEMRYGEDSYFFSKMVYYYPCTLLDVRMAECIIPKKRWGDSGLSGDLWGMEKGELFHLRQVYKNGFISRRAYISATVFSLLKCIRRYLLAFLRFS